MFSLSLSINTAFLLTSVEHVKNNKKLLFFLFREGSNRVGGRIVRKEKKKQGNLTLKLG